jgi:hypothetical protein
MTDGDPNALLIVTMNYNTPGGTQYVYDPHPISVYWNSVKNGWDIFNSDLAVMPPNAVFNVLVVKH